MELAQLKKLPKVALHDHLDGGLRPETVIAHLGEIGLECPSDDAELLGEWFYESANSGSLPAYLQTFEYTVAAMSTREHIRRVAREAVLDLAEDSVVYAELRWAPEQHTGRGLTPEAAVKAARDGLADGMAEAAALGRRIVARQVLTAMRHADPDPTMAELAVAFRDDSVVGFDIAGAEEGFPSTRFAKVFDYLRRQNMPYTIHAGEGSGAQSVFEAVQLCGARRIGHGVRIIEDIDFSGAEPKLGRLAQYVLDNQIMLEVCPTSNVQTGICSAVAEHPVGVLFDLGFNISINCDNRLMSGTTMSEEFWRLHEAFGWDATDFQRVAVDALNASFLHHEEKQELLATAVLPGYAR
ncbi:adenosine deaminase [Tessaracoccus sp. OH4464_COT-324]|uniref:adenosine deaminase n=1 Tax=Tessaracoccus sp. OH4464_COT-324 TaxID=2491059 RepID=UPI000F641C26|nr:adenosine deaminase [Tessaracoccus sp. OH4464_COT-324]RRD46668.1 adenosine deaminase [Tessaracoccus sp. OH4464_COT-324]